MLVALLRPFALFHAGLFGGIGDSRSHVCDVLEVVCHRREADALKTVE
jgi:hypothetical protein